MPRAAPATTALLAAALALGPTLARADDINAGGVPFKNITIQKVDGDKLVYRTVSGQTNEKQITDKMKLTVTDEPNLTMAEDAFLAGKWSDAVDGYQKAMRSSAKPWVKDFAAIRLLAAGEKSERFDAVVAAYLHVLEKDPKTAKEMKITYPSDPNNSYLKTAATQVQAAIDAEKDPAKSISLKVFRMNVAQAMKDEPTVMKLAGELQGSAASASPNSRAGTAALDPTALAGIIDGKLTLIQGSIEKKDFKGARAALEQVKASVVDPKQASEWLWLDAEAADGAAADSKDPAALKDVAIDYMRVVANFPQSPHAPQALLKTAAILERLNDSKAAIGVYEQIEREYRDQPAIAAEARKNLNRLNGTDSVSGPVTDLGAGRGRTEGK
jgi:tetratricopeptide (TPR) repeat protein